MDDTRQGDWYVDFRMKQRAIIEESHRRTEEYMDDAYRRLGEIYGTHWSGGYITPSTVIVVR